MANSVEQVGLTVPSTQDLVEAVFQDVQRSDGNCTEVHHLHLK